MEHAAILTADYLDIIFDNRNKNYGGYELRKHYNQRATRATLGVLAAILLLIGAHALASQFQPVENIALKNERAIDISSLDIETPKPKMQLEHAPPKPPAPTQAFSAPKIVQNNEVVEAAPTQEDIKDKEIGTVTTDGDPNGTEAAISLNTGTGGTGAAPTGLVEAPAIASNKIEDIVQQMPEFIGNIGEYLARNIQYPQMARESGVSGRVVIRFVVNEDGSVSGAQVIKGIGAGCEEEALRVINSMPKWRPGKQNGKAVKVYYTLPVNFKLS
jgi:protein TonB